MVLLNESIRTTSDRGVQRMKAEENKFLPLPKRKKQHRNKRYDSLCYKEWRKGWNKEILFTSVQRTKDKGSKSPQTKPIIKPEGYGTTTTYVPLDTASIELPSSAHAFPDVRTIFKRGCNPIPIQVFSFNDSREEFLTILSNRPVELS